MNAICRRGRLDSLAALATAVLVVCAASARAVDDDDRIAVPPADELEVLDPHVDPEGKPRVLTRPTGDGLEVDIPPAVIVHRYYYTGDRSFQGPRLPGGPTIVVVNHPSTGERQYLEMQMLPGAPRVIYRRDRIEYDFGTQRLVLKFSDLCGTKVLIQDTEDDNFPEPDEPPGQNWLHRTGIPHAVGHVARGTRDVLHGTADRIHDTGRIVVAPVAQALESLPLVQTLQTSADERAVRARDAAVRRAGREQQTAETFLRTVR
ncbi:MAG: hypothetical protein KY476_16835 [Planctomycetes bacterium]|nr:hypothetical protein [Planctomycetota bacterium]